MEELLQKDCGGHLFLESKFSKPLGNKCKILQE